MEYYIVVTICNFLHINQRMAGMPKCSTLELFWQYLEKNKTPRIEAFIGYLVSSAAKINLEDKQCIKY